MTSSEFIYWHSNWVLIVLPFYPAHFYSREKKLSQSCGSSLHYIDGAISLNNERLSDLLVRFISVSWIENMDTRHSASNLRIYSKFEPRNWWLWSIEVEIAQQTRGIKFSNCKLSGIHCSGFQAAHAYGVYIYININLYGGRRGRDRIANYMQSVAIATKLVSSNPVHCEVYSIQNYVIKCVSNLWQVGGLLRFFPPIKLTATL